MIDQALFGDTIYAIDVCYDNTGCATLVVGGTPFYDCGQVYNIRIYKIDCNGLLIPTMSAYYEGGTVRSLKWCCQADTPNSKIWYLASVVIQLKKDQRQALISNSIITYQVAIFLNHL